MDVNSIFRKWCLRLAAGTCPRLGHRAIRSDYLEALRSPSISFDVVYADPPYTRDHYSRYYHVLETMALYDEPSISTTKIRTGGVQRYGRAMYRDDRHQSAFSIKSKAPVAFQALFEAVAARDVPLVLSYSPWNEASGNRPRMLSQEDLLTLARKTFHRVNLCSIDGARHNKFNRRERNVDVDIDAEILLVCTEPRYG